MQKRAPSVLALVRARARARAVYTNLVSMHLHALREKFFMLSSTVGLPFSSSYHILAKRIQSALYRASSEIWESSNQTIRIEYVFQDTHLVRSRYTAEEKRTAALCSVTRSLVFIWRLLLPSIPNWRLRRPIHWQRWVVVMARAWRCKA